MAEVAGVQPFGSVEEMYVHDERRRRSPESDYGVWWKGGLGGVWRGSWIEVTGDFYVVNQRLAVPVRLDSNGHRTEVWRMDYAASRDGGGVLVWILGTVDGRDSVENLLEGWADECGKERSLGWLLGKFT